MGKKHIVTSALLYANGPIHIGHIAGAYLPADIYVRFLKLNNEDFDEKGIRENIYVHGANNKSTNRPISLIESMNYEQCQQLVKKAEKELCERFEYNAF